MADLNTYATLDQLRARFAVASTDTSDDVRMLAKLRAASAQIERACARTFAPVLATRTFDWKNARVLLFRAEDLLVLQTLTNGDGSIIDPAAIIPLGGVNGPLYGVELNITKAFFVYLTTKTRALSVTGLWGWHDDYANAWKASGDSVSAASLSASATTITVTNAAGADSWNMSPRFQSGQLISIDSEYMQVAAVNTLTNVLSVVRAANGTLAATHALNAPITVYVPPVDVTELCLRWAAWLIKQEDAGDYGVSGGSSGGMTSEAAAGGLKIGSSAPPDLLMALDPLRKVGGAV